MKRIAVVLAAFTMATTQAHAQHPRGRYIVNVLPVKITPTNGACFAVDPTKVHGVWWWEPMQLKCATRSTGPGVFHADSSVVTGFGNGSVEFRFQIEMMPLPGERHGRPLQIAMRIRDGVMRSLTQAGSSSIAIRRNDLNIPQGW